jgi:hypothetical protein
MKAIADISPSRYIAPFHKTRDDEASHIIMKPVIYHNLYTDGLPAQPIFGVQMSSEVYATMHETLSSGGYVGASLNSPACIQS